jgi:hypothetical protein
VRFGDGRIYLVTTDIAAGDVWVATGADRQIAGVVALAPGNKPGTLDLNKLFIGPRPLAEGAIDDVGLQFDQVGLSHQADPRPASRTSRPHRPGQTAAFPRVERRSGIQQRG